MKLKYIYTAASLLLILAGYSCSDINFKHQDWLDEGERIYSGRLDSIRARGGYERIAIEGGANYTRTAVRGVLEWDDNVLEYNMDEITHGNIVRIMLDNMPEGSYRFFFTTYDSDGNSSVRDECFGYSYGEEYREFAQKKIVIGAEISNDSLVLSLTQAEKVAYVRFEYLDGDGVSVTENVPGDSVRWKIGSWMGGKLIATTYSIPEENAFDTIALDPLEFYLPVSKKTFRPVTLPTDIDGKGYSGIGVQGMWDGVYGNAPAGRYHSRDNEGVPHHLTFDMGFYADLKRVKIYGSSDNSYWNPKRFQLWGRYDLDNAETTLESDDPGWEDEMVAKGWTLLLDATNPDRIENEHSMPDHDPFMVRYIRYRLVENVGPPGGGGPNSGKGVYGLCQELDFWASDLNYID